MLGHLRLLCPQQNQDTLKSFQREESSQIRNFTYNGVVAGSSFKPFPSDMQVGYFNISE